MYLRVQRCTSLLHAGKRLYLIRDIHRDTFGASFRNKRSQCVHLYVGTTPLLTSARNVYIQVQRCISLLHAGMRLALQSETSARILYLGTMPWVSSARNLYLQVQRCTSLLHAGKRLYLIRGTPIIILLKVTRRQVQIRSPVPSAEGAAKKRILVRVLAKAARRCPKHER